MNALTRAVAAATFAAAAAQYSVVDDHGHVVGTLITDATLPAQMRVAGISAERGTPPGPDRARTRTFQPDYAHALSVDQMTRAWRDEADRLNPPLVTGGG